MVEASQKLARELAAHDRGGPLPNPAHMGQARNTNARLYLDASRSMAGFVGCSGSPTEFDQVMDRLANDLEITDVRLFGTPPGAGSLVEERPLDRSVHCPDAFRRLQNPDYELYALLEHDSTVNVYITDGVQSATRATTPSPSVAALQRWLAGGRALAILAYRSRFTGDAWSEQRNGWIGPVNVPDRPFYVFVLASTEEAVDETIARISPEEDSLPEGSARSAGRLRPDLTLRFPAAPFACEIRRKIGAQQMMDPPPWALVPPSVHRQMVGNPIPVADYICTIRDGYPLRTVEGTLRADYRRWDGQKFGDPTPLPEGASLRTRRSLATGDRSVTVVQGTIPLDQPGTLFGFYHVRLSPRPGALKAQMDSLSTNSDIDPAQFNRTYRFSWLVEHLVRSQFARGPHPASLFLTIQDGR